MPIAKEGLREIGIATLVLGGLCVVSSRIYWPLGVPFVATWIWVLWFFRDPRRDGTFGAGDLCAPADGTVTDMSALEHHPPIGGPALRIGIFLSLMSVHANRMPCSGRIRSVTPRAGTFLDARRADSGQRNESNTLIIDPDGPLSGPVEVRQVAGFAARRIICHAKADEHWPIGARFGMIKFGSRTELIIPREEGTEILVKIGDRVRAGITIVARQSAKPGEPDPNDAPTSDTLLSSTPSLRVGASGIG